MEISFTKFRESLKDKWVKYTWTYNLDNESKVKEFESCRFYANKDKTMINMPKFIIGINQKFTQISDKIFKTESEHGSILYEILGDTKPCPECNSTEHITKKLRHLECTNPSHENTMVKFT